MPDMDLIENIRRVEADIRQGKAQLKELGEELEEIATNAAGYRRVAELTEELGTARKMLQAELAEDTDYQRTSDAAGEIKFKLKDSQDILSAHLLEYREHTQTDYVEEEDSKKVRNIVVTAKLSKPEYHQEALEFTGDVEVTGLDGKVIHRSKKAEERVLSGKELAAGEGSE